MLKSNPQLSINKLLTILVEIINNPIFSKMFFYIDMIFEIITYSDSLKDIK